MLRKLYNWLVGNWCQHEWEEIERLQTFLTSMADLSKRIPRGYEFILRCKKCGEITKRRV